MKYLNLSNNRIGDKGAKFLSGSVHFVKKLCLSFCRIETLGVENLSNAICDSTKPVRSYFKFEQIVVCYTY